MTEVLLLTNLTVPDKSGGLERYVRELATELVGRGYGVTLVAKRRDASHPLRETCRDGVRIERIPVPGKRNPLFALLYPFAVGLGVRGALRRRPDALLHFHFAVPALPLALLPRRFRRPYLYTFHAPVHRELLSERQGSYLLPRPLQRPAVRLLRAAERRVVRGAEEVVVLSEYMRGRLADLAPEAAERAVRIPGGVHERWFADRPVPPDAWAAGAAPLVVTARRLTPRTGVLELVRAMPAILAERPGARLVVLGDGGQRAEVEREIETHGLRGAVRLLGRVPDADLGDWYRRADVAVTPSQELEGFGLSTAEAMASGAVPLVTPVGANPELVRELPSGCLAAGTSPGDLARAVVDLTAADAGAVAARSRRVAAAWSWEAVSAAHEARYARLGRPVGGAAR